MIKIDIMKYLVTKDIPVTEDGVGAKVGDILTVGWYKDMYSCWALFKEDHYICDLTSYFGTHHCEEMVPEIS
jgi:hypothetical protein